MLARRDVLNSIAAAPVAAGGLAAVLADPRRVRAAAGSLETVTATTASGKQVGAALGVPAETPAPAIVLVHEWWGLNDQIKAVGAELTAMGYVSLSVDLYGGEVTDNPDEARALVDAVDLGEGRETMAAWIDWLRASSQVNDTVGTVGWCFGGGWSLDAALVRPVEATVVYYGDVSKSATELAPLKGPVLGHFATEDKWIDEQMVGGFEDAMAEAGKSVEIHWYEAQHGFANPTSARYDEADARLAWERTTEFFSRILG